MIELICFRLTNESNIEVGLALEARGVWKPPKGGNSTENGIGLQTSPQSLVGAFQ
jgi:hypothetical protein